MSIFNAILALLVLVNFTSFIWAALHHFQLNEKMGKSVKRLSALALLSKAAIIIACLLGQPSPNLQLGIAILLLFLSAGLFWGSIQTNAKNRLTAAYSNNLPTHLVQNGPYRYIRHPFYTAYLLTYLGGAIGSGLWWAFIAFLIPFVIYWQAASFEEQKFSKSQLSNEYEQYRRKAGRFLPKFIITF